ncbi:N-acetylmuramoyl-L-alanine amidase [Bacteroidia bacterium]|nr:N-acetylmuramoyl-L-alanine amidase [Bacteroidia bacterium]
MKTVILDNGHGIYTAGKRSPVWADGSQLFEYEFNRDVVKRIARYLENENIPYSILVPELDDISLSERVRRANEIYKYSGNNAYLISIHANAGGGTGWECFTSVGQTKADPIATILCEEAQKEFPDLRIRFDYSDGDPDKESQFYILKNTHCPAVLTENFFMDTEKDCRFIMSEEGRQRVARMHVKAIKRIA